MSASHQQLEINKLPQQLEINELSLEGIVAVAGYLHFADLINLSRTSSLFQSLVTQYFELYIMAHKAQQALKYSDTGFCYETSGTHYVGMEELNRVFGNTPSEFDMEEFIILFTGTIVSMLIQEDVKYSSNYYPYISREKIARELDFYKDNSFLNKTLGIKEIFKVGELVLKRELPFDAQVIRRDQFKERKCWVPIKDCSVDPEEFGSGFAFHLTDPKRVFFSQIPNFQKLFNHNRLASAEVFQLTEPERLLMQDKMVVELNRRAGEREEQEMQELLGLMNGFKRIYRALYDSQISFSNDNFLQGKENISSIELLRNIAKNAAHNPTGPVAKAWSLLQKYKDNLTTQNEKLMLKIYCWSFANSDIPRTSTIYPGLTFYKTSELKEHLKSHPITSKQFREYADKRSESEDAIAAYEIRSKFQRVNKSLIENETFINKF